MADETTTEKPLAQLAEAEKNIEPPVDTRDPGDPRPSDGRPTNQPEAGETTATDRLRAFEDLHFGKNAVRINGRIERGSGSPYQMAHPSVREQHVRLEHLIATEQKLVEAHAALMAADEAHDEAQKAVEDAESRVDAPSDE